MVIKNERPDNSKYTHWLMRILFLVIVKHLPPNRRSNLYGDNESPGSYFDL